MPGFDGTGPRGMGPVTGGGRGFCRPWGLGVARPMYGFPRWTYASPYYGAYGFGPFAPPVTREQELEFLKAESEALRQQLSDIQHRIDELDKKRK